jgi:hypothetical protein
MADLSTLNAPRPSTVEVVPASTVDALVAGNERELLSLRRDLEEARREAEVAEARLRDLHGGVEIDEAFEAEVMDHVNRSAADVERGIEEEVRRLLAEASHQAQLRARRVEPPAGSAPLAQPEIVGVLGPFAAAPSPGPTLAEPVASARLAPSAVVPASAPPPSHATSVVPQARPVVVAPVAAAVPTTVVPSVAPRPAESTAVVAQVAPAPPPPAPADGTPPAALHEEFWAEEREASSGGWASKLPANMLLQVSAVIVIMALILLKLA